ncbi:MAG: SRPBCC family protein [Opitutales bacterium]|nr:SRPBCC family protein [Opitutales bacterium]
MTHLNTPSLAHGQDRLLRSALLGNSFFSALCGLVMLAAPETVGSWLGLSVTWVYRGLGVGLLLFAADLLHQATRPRMASWRGLYASFADFAWVGCTGLLLVFVPHWFSLEGIVLLAGVAAVVLACGIFQFWGVKHLHQLSHSPDHYRHCVLIEVNVAAAGMWETIAQLGEISRFMPALKYSSIRDNRIPGEGCVRQCEDQTAKQWAEECTLFDPQSRSVVFQFLCDEPGFPFPATAMRGGWKVNPIGTNSCEVMVWWEMVPKPQWLAPVLLPLLALQVDRDFPQMIARMAANKDKYANDTTASKAVRLAPRFC